MGAMMPSMGISDDISDDISDEISDDISDDVRIAYRTCPLCEAGCGLEVSLRG